MWALAWLDALVVSAARGHRLRDWETVAARHPLVEQRQAANPDAAVPTPADLALLGRSTRSRATWDTARSACVNGELAVPGIDSALAAWMDAGMFSRDVPLMFPDAPDLVTTAVELVPDEVRDAVEMVAAAFGVTR